MSSFRVRVHVRVAFRSWPSLPERRSLPVRSRERMGACRPRSRELDLGRRQMELRLYTNRSLDAANAVCHCGTSYCGRDNARARFDRVGRPARATSETGIESPSRRADPHHRPVPPRAATPPTARLDIGTPLRLRPGRQPSGYVSQNCTGRFSLLPSDQSQCPSCCNRPTTIPGAIPRSAANSTTASSVASRVIRGS